MNEQKSSNQPGMLLIIGNGNEVNIGRNPQGLGCQNIVKVLIKTMLSTLALAFSFG